MLRTPNLSEYAYRAGWALTKKLPQPVASALFNAIADIASQRGKKPEQLRKNLARVVGPENVTRQLVRESMRSYLRYWREAFQLPSMLSSGGAGGEGTLDSALAAHLDQCFRESSQARLAASIASGRGVVLALPHAGNWDMAGVWLVKHHGTFSTVAERLRPESLFQAFLEYRETLGFHVIALTGSQQPPLEQLAATLRHGGIVCLLGDRDLTRRGVEVEFFGETAKMPPGPAYLAKTTGAALHVAEVAFGPAERPGTGKPGWVLGVGEEIPTTGSIADITQEIAHQFAENIAAHPADWHMLQPLWLSDLEERA